jgi:hypothetical protein
MVFAKSGYYYYGCDCCDYDFDDDLGEIPHCVIDCIEDVNQILTELSLNVTSYICVFY